MSTQVFTQRINDNVNTIMKHLAAIADHLKPEFGVSYAQRHLFGQDVMDALAACGDIIFVTQLEADRDAILQDIKARSAAESTPAPKPAKRKTKKAKRTAKA